MPAPRRTWLIVSGALFLSVAAFWLIGDRRPAGTPTSDSFQASDLTLIGHTGLPQLVEFYHPG